MDLILILLRPHLDIHLQMLLYIPHSHNLMLINKDNVLLVMLISSYLIHILMVWLHILLLMDSYNLYYLYTTRYNHLNYLIDPIVMLMLMLVYIILNILIITPRILTVFTHFMYYIPLFILFTPLLIHVNLLIILLLLYSIILILIHSNRMYLVSLVKKLHSYLKIQNYSLLIHYLHSVML